MDYKGWTIQVYVRPKLAGVFEAGAVVTAPGQPRAFLPALGSGNTSASASRDAIDGARRWVDSRSPASAGDGR